MSIRINRKALNVLDIGDAHRICSMHCACTGVYIALAAAAAFDHHVLVVLDDDLFAVIDVQNGDGFEAGGDAAGLRDQLWIDGVDEGLDDGVVGGVEVVREVVGAVPLARVGLVPGGGDDPVVPADLGEVHVQLVTSTSVVLLPAALSTSGRRRRLCRTLPVALPGSSR